MAQTTKGERIRVVAALALAAAASTPLQAQRVELQILGGQVSDESGAVGRGLTIQPAVAWAGMNRSLRLEGRGTALQGGGRLMGGGAAFFLGLPTGGFVQPIVSGSGSLLSADGGFRSLSGELNPGVRLGTSAASIGAGAGVRAVSLSSSPAAWRQSLPFSGSAERTAVAQSLWGDGQLSSGPLSLSVQGRTSRSDGRSWRDAQVGVALQQGSLTLSGFAGARTGDSEGQWAGGAAGIRVAPGVELVAQVARLASDPLTGQLGGRSATIGVSLTHGSANNSPSRAPRSVSVALKASPGARVELLADWNDWRPEPMSDQGGGRFTREVRLAPGVYHFVFRVNGQVRVPEGYETVPDDFGGRSAVLRVRG